MLDHVKKRLINNQAAQALASSLANKAVGALAKLFSRPMHPPDALIAHVGIAA